MRVRPDRRRPAAVIGAEEYRAAVRKAVARTLAEAGCLPTPEAHCRTRDAVAAAGAEAWREITRRIPYQRLDDLFRALVRLGVRPAALSRVLGYGMQQSLAFQRAIGMARCDSSALAGATLNLAVVLYDLVCDRVGADAAAALQTQLDPERLLRHGLSIAPPSDVAGLATYAVAHLMNALEASERPAGFHQVFWRGVRRMYQGQVAAARGPGGGHPPQLRDLRAKGILPVWCMALAATAVDAERLDGALSRSRGFAAFGSCLWITDDLVDAPEDGAQGISSRPWRRLGSAGAPDGLGALLDRGVVEDEARRLRVALARVPRECLPILGDTLASWIA